MEVKRITIYYDGEGFDFNFDGEWAEHEALGALELCKLAAIERRADNGP